MSGTGNGDSTNTAGSAHDKVGGDCPRCAGRGLSPAAWAVRATYHPDVLALAAGVRGPGSEHPGLAPLAWWDKRGRAETLARPAADRSDGPALPLGPPGSVTHEQASRARCSLLGIDWYCPSCDGTGVRPHGRTDSGQVRPGLRAPRPAGGAPRSHHVLIYGPPAVGKLTTGRALARLTGYGLAHNHLTVDVGRAVFGPDEDARRDLVSELRLVVAAEAASKGVSVVTTLAYSGPVDDPWIDRLVATVRAHDGRVCFVRLTAPADVLLGRATAAHRVDMGKIHDPGRLAARLVARDHSAAVRYPGITVDTTASDPERTARLLRREFGLARTVTAHGSSAASGDEYR